MSIDQKELEDNCQRLVKKNSKAKEIIKLANGKLDYKKIASIVKQHPTKVSGLLKYAEKLNLAEKKNGFYKKQSAILGLLKSPTKVKDSKILLKNEISEKTRKKIKNSFVNDDFATKTCLAYHKLFILENILRQIIRTAFKDIPNWQKNEQYINKGIQDDVERVIKNERYDTIQRDDILDYTHLGQLKQIIESKNNWKLISSFFKEKEKTVVTALITKAISPRNAIAHSIKMKKDDLNKVEVRFDEILDMINTDNLQKI